MTCSAIFGSGDWVSIVLTSEAVDQDVRPESITGFGDDGAIRPRLTIRAGFIFYLAIRFLLSMRLKCHSIRQTPTSFFLYFYQRVNHIENEPIQIREHIFG